MKNFMSLILAKVFNNSSYADGFLRGKIYINQLTSYGIGNLYNPREDMNNKYRGDLNEGLKSNIPADKLNQSDSLNRFFDDIGGLPHGSASVGELDSRFLSKHVLSLLAIYYDTNNNSFILPDKRMISFDESHDGGTVVIYNVNEFLCRLVTASISTLGSPFWLAYGLVDYGFSLDNRHELYEFCKTKEYKWQQEFRFAIDVGISSFEVNSDKITYDVQSEAICIDIGDINDIAFLLPTGKFLELEFPDEYDWILRNPPEQVCPFYPPERNMTSYSCPVMRSKTGLYYGTKALYPIIRDSHSYSINRITTEKSAGMTAAADEHFLKHANLYFSRLLDIYKNRGDTEGLSSLLTAITTYMIMLNIQELSDIHLAVDGTGITPSYHNPLLIDTTLLDKEHSYHTIHRQLIRPTNTDFAELAAISNDIEFPEYEYEGKKYCRIVVNQNATLSSGRKVSNGEAVWVAVSKIKWFAVPED